MDQRHNSFTMADKRARWWLGRGSIVVIVFLGFIAFYPATEYTTQITQFLPWLIFLSCPFRRWLSPRGCRQSSGHGHIRKVLT